MEFNRKTQTSLTAKLRRSLQKHQMLEPHDCVVAAVSGGADSVCLLHVLNSLSSELALTIIVAHFNHGLRPQEDDRETHFVAGLAQSMELAFECGHPEPPLQTRAASLEERARLARHAFLEEVRRRCRADKIALAHNMQDQAETVLMRLLRGSGLEGLAAIPPFRDGILIRPLLEVTRSEIEAYLQECGLSFMTDSSNLTTDHLRNRIRLELLPQLTNYQPDIIRKLATTAEILRLDQACLHDWALEWLKSNALFSRKNTLRIPVPDLIVLPEGLQNHIIREGLRQTAGSLRGFSLRHTEAIKGLCSGGGSRGPLQLPGRIAAWRRYGELSLGPFEPAAPAPELSFQIPAPGTYRLPDSAKSISLYTTTAVGALPAGTSPWRVSLDAEQLQFPLQLRHPKAGDRFRPLGMAGTRKLKNFLIDLKVPREQRRRLMVLTHRQDSEIIWVAGCRLDDRGKVTSSTRSVLAIEISNGGPLPSE